jgi:hypothetical protein
MSPQAFEPQFWVVWNEDGGSPTFKHPDYASARKEAQRLARIAPGQRFVVLAAAVSFVKRDLDETHYGSDQWLMDQEIPF